MLATREGKNLVLRSSGRLLSTLKPKSRKRSPLMLGLPPILGRSASCARRFIEIKHVNSINVILFMKLASISFQRAKLEKLNDSPDLFTLIILNLKSFRKFSLNLFPLDIGW